MTATSPRWGKNPCHQDIDMPAIAKMARRNQPGLIIVDRAVEGPYQNYHTPEQEVPEEPLDTPWETCLTMGTSWSFVPNDDYKPASRLVRLLVDIVAKGGNLLLNIGPNPKGELPGEARDRLRELGAWMKVNGGAIYSTRALEPYKDGRVCYTHDPGGAVNAIYLSPNEEPVLPAQIAVPSFVPKAGTGCVIHVPQAVRDRPPCRFAWAFRLDVER